MRYVFDTNILIYYVRDKATKQYVEENFAPFDKGNDAIVSFVSVGEMKALAIKNGWGSKRKAALDRLLQKVVVIELKYDELLEYYAQIDAYSQGKLPIGGTKFSARNMGKNDIWIAATTMLVEGTLLTSDNDFDHLDRAFFRVKKIENID